MKISESTKEVLKNFAEINQNLLINPNKKLSTISTMKNILTDPDRRRISNRVRYLLSIARVLEHTYLFQKPVLTFDEKIYRSMKVFQQVPIIISVTHQY